MDATLITAVVLGLAAFVVFAYIIFILFTAFAGDTKGLSDKLKIKRKERCLVDADIFSKTGNLSEAISMLQQGFFLEHIRSTPPLVDMSVNLHLSILSRLITLAERKGVRLENLAVVEDLVQTRGQLLHGYISTQRERRVLRKKRTDSGKAFPDWAYSEYDRKLADLQDKIQTNRRSLDAQIEKLFSALTAYEGESGVTYH